MLNQTHQLAPATLKDLLSKVRFPILDSNQMGETGETEWKRWLKTFDTNTVVTPGDSCFFSTWKKYMCAFCKSEDYVAKLCPGDSVTLAFKHVFFICHTIASSL